MEGQAVLMGTSNAFEVYVVNDKRTIGHKFMESASASE